MFLIVNLLQEADENYKRLIINELHSVQDI